MGTVNIMTKATFSPTDDQVWPAQGQWTYEDYLRLPDDGRRYECIEGVLYVVNASSFEHQFTVSEVFGAMWRFVKDHQLGVVLPAPFEVHLSGTTRPVQPDITFITAEKQPTANISAFEGVPDLIVEILSPSSIRTDRHVKFDAYERAGVSEYWIVNPRTHSVEVYTLSGGEYGLLGEFITEDKIVSEVLAGIEIVAQSLFPFTT